ncbi:prostaglandin reductase 1-like [Chelonus insularis]|uniref:prostaglandin reductase 1-like n=1 Tax=Chelonus insularis TaxID=460826 RepID=UPI00158E9ABA|nr:prostaglandin reductase 1-like [Chelonus insularis]
MVIAKKYVIEKYFKGDPQLTDVKIVEEQLPSIKDGEYLVQAEYLSVDPYMWKYMSQYPLGSTMIGFQIGKIIESKNTDFPVGKYIFGHLGWRTHTIVNPSTSDPTNTLNFSTYLIPDLGDLPISLCLGVLGMPGNTAYFGFTEICKPQAGNTLVVSGAAGAVGSHVCQIGKILGLKVIGIAGTDAKCRWLTKDLGIDYAINYKTQDIGSELKKAAPSGIDYYFDNVGGEISSTVMYQMNLMGTVSVCGSISAYKSEMDALPKCTVVQPAILKGQLKVEGFMVIRWADRWMEGIQQNLTWIREGKLKYHETVTEGFENMFNAFTSMLKGGNTGKAVVKV